MKAIVLAEHPLIFELEITREYSDQRVFRFSKVEFAR